jgi:hypothetical protein
VEIYKGHEEALVGDEVLISWLGWYHRREHMSEYIR